MNTKALTLFLFFILASCSTGFQTIDDPPEWSESESFQEDGLYYFVGVGRSDNPDAAQENAVESLLNTIFHQLGIIYEDLDPLSEEGRYLEDLRARVLKGVQFNRSALNGFNLEYQLYLVEDKDTIVFYLLTSFTEEGLSLLKTDLARFFWINDPSVMVIEEEALQLAKEEQYYRSAVAYVSAAYTSIESAPLLSDVIFQRDLERALDLIKRVDFTAVDLPVQSRGQMGRPFIFDVGETGAAFDVTFQERLPSGEMRFRTVKVFSDEDGLLVFYFPMPAFSGESILDVSLNMDFLNHEFVLNQRQSGQVREMRTYLQQTKRSYPFVIEDNTKEIPMGIFILDTDLINNPLRENYTENALYAYLIDSGYNVEILDTSPNILLENNAQEMIRDLRSLYKDLYGRILFGKAQIADFKTDANFYSIETEGWFIVFDLETGSILFEQEFNKATSAQDSQQAIAATFRLMARSCADAFLRANP